MLSLVPGDSSTTTYVTQDVRCDHFHALCPAFYSEPGSRRRVPISATVPRCHTGRHRVRCCQAGGEGTANVPLHSKGSGCLPTGRTEGFLVSSSCLRLCTGEAERVWAALCPYAEARRPRDEWRKNNGRTANIPPLTPPNALLVSGLRYTVKGRRSKCESIQASMYYSSNVNTRSVGNCCRSVHATRAGSAPCGCFEKSSG